jgi:alanyl aminopeptidase
MALVETFHNDPERPVFQGALNLALWPSVHLVPDRARPNYQRFLCKNFQARAHDLGWLPRNGESDDAKLVRPNLLRAVATYGGDQELAGEARTLADQWLTDQRVLPSEMIPAILGTAAYYGDKARFDQFLTRYRKTNDRQERSFILNAMSENPGLLQSFRDPAAIQAEKEAVLSGAVPFLEGAALLFTGQRSEATRRMPFEFMKAHFEELAAKRPTVAGHDFGSFFPYVGAEFCDEKSQAELKSFFELRVNQLTGAPRVLSQVLESIDACIAEKQVQAPNVERFLETR